MPQPGLPFEAQGVQYTVERATDACSTRRRDATRTGSVLGEIEAEVRFALGSGTRGTTFLIERDGFLFQSPIAWFAQQRRWDISPGYGDLAHARTSSVRSSPNACSATPTNSHHVSGTLNRYEPPIFEGHAIGCERCHGPGELHVNQDGPSAESDLTIVNPANLAPALRDSVCQQCHLQGWFRFPRAGRDSSTSAPACRSTDSWQSSQGKEQRGKIELVGQVEQMESSRCFRASQGQLGCISCHDPHRLPRRRPRPPTTASVASRATNRRAAPCRRPSDKLGARATTASHATCRAWPSRTSPTRRGPTTASPAACPVACCWTARDAPGSAGRPAPRDYHWG